jgi:hypothetical protein
VEDWFFQHPNTVITRTYRGDREIAVYYQPDATKLLYELKNLMKFRQLGQLKMTRLFTDGTVITARSVFGHDFVEVDVSQTVTGEAATVVPECTVTLIDMPEVVQPMQYPAEVRTGEVDKTDYFKTYYTVDITKCKKCKDMEVDFAFSYATPVEPRHYFNQMTQLDEPNNH